MVDLMMQEFFYDENNQPLHLVIIIEQFIFHQSIMVVVFEHLEF
jgi:hypothetical protein